MTVDSLVQAIGGVSSGLGGAPPAGVDMPQRFDDRRHRPRQVEDNGDRPQEYPHHDGALAWRSPARTYSCSLATSSAATPGKSRRGLHGPTALKFVTDSR